MVNTFNRNDGTFAQVDYASITGTPGSGAMSLLNTLTINNVPSVSDTTSLTVAFSNYLIIFQSIVPTNANGDFVCQIQSGGVFQGAGYISSSFNNNGTTSSSGTGTAAVLVGTHGNWNTVGPGLSGVMQVPAPASGNRVVLTGNVGFFGSSTAILGIYAGWWNTVGAVTGIQFLGGNGAGNLVSGTVKIYGIL